MKRFKTLLGFLSIAILTSFLTIASVKSDKPEASSEPLLPLMHQLMADMNQVNTGIYMEQYALIDSAAYNIAHHPKINPEQMKIIKKNLGDEMQEFVRLDMIVHHYADSISLAARHEDMQKIMKHYTIVQNGCVDCHNQFRARLRNKLQ